MSIDKYNSNDLILHFEKQGTSWINHEFKSEFAENFRNDKILIIF